MTSKAISVSCTLFLLLLLSLYVTLLTVLPKTTAIATNNPCHVTKLAYGNGAIPKALVNLPDLPEAFDNSKLPAEQQNASECHDLIGCFEPIPMDAEHHGPQEIGTQFMFHATDCYSIVEFKRVENCLKKDNSECEIYPFDLHSLAAEVPFKVSHRTLILVGGFKTVASTDWQTAVTRIWHDLEDVNVITIDWLGANFGSFRKAAANTRVVARQITVLLYYLAKLNGLDISDDSFAERIYMVGDSLGAHIAGFVGHDLAGGLGRITGLDPASIFDNMDARFRLNPSRARLVDALHTNVGTTAGSYGSALTAGHIDLFANSGTDQPGKASEFYTEFLEHELKMRNKLKGMYSSIYRLNAYVGIGSYDNFVSGASLAKHCPSTFLSDTDLYSKDIGKCSVPVDYVTWYDHIRDELGSKHGIDFSSTNTVPYASRAAKKYHFYTRAHYQAQFEHYVARIRVVGSGQSSESQDDKGAGYKVVKKGLKMKFSMDQSEGYEHQVDMYGVLDDTILVPYLSGQLESEYEISKLDSEDFYITKQDKEEKIGNIDKLQRSLTRVFAASIELDGLRLTYDLDPPNQTDTTEADANKDIQVEMKQLQSFLVRPLRRFHRSIVAEYKLKGTALGDWPKVVLVSDKSGPDNEDGDNKHGDKSTNKDRCVESEEVSHLVLDTVYIGPFDKGLVAIEEDELDYDDIFPADASVYTAVSATIWISLTILLLITIVALAGVTSLRVKKVDEIDKHVLTIMIKDNFKPRHGQVEMPTLS